MLIRTSFQTLEHDVDRRWSAADCGDVAAVAAAPRRPGPARQDRPVLGGNASSEVRM